MNVKEGDREFKGRHLTISKNKHTQKGLSYVLIT